MDERGARQLAVARQLQPRPAPAAAHHQLGVAPRPQPGLVVREVAGGAAAVDRAAGLDTVLVTQAPASLHRDPEDDEPLLHVGVEGSALVEAGGRVLPRGEVPVRVGDGEGAADRVGAAAGPAVTELPLDVAAPGVQAGAAPQPAVAGHLMLQLPGHWSPVERIARDGAAQVGPVPEDEGQLARLLALQGETLRADPGHRHRQHQHKQHPPHIGTLMSGQRSSSSSSRDVVERWRKLVRLVGAGARLRGPGTLTSNRNQLTLCTEMDTCAAKIVWWDSPL